MVDKTIIQLNWDTAGRISTTTTGRASPDPTKNMRVLVAPSSVLFLAHQFGVFIPSKALSLCDKIFNLLFKDKYELLSINPILKSVALETIFAGASSIKFLVHPNHSLFAKSELIEEGMQNLINNYFVYIYSQPDEILQYTLKRITSISIEIYFRFIEQEINNEHIGKNLDTWTPSFQLTSAKLINLIVSNWNVPTFYTTDKFKNWKNEELRFYVEQKAILSDKRNSVFNAIGLA